MAHSGPVHKFPPLTGLVVTHSGSYYKLPPLARLVVAHSGPHHKLLPLRVSTGDWGGGCQVVVRSSIDHYGSVLMTGGVSGYGKVQ